MGISTHQGMETYNRIIQSARAEGKPIGPKHHEYNRQRKEWDAKNSNLKQTTRPAPSSTAKIPRPKIDPVAQERMRADLDRAKQILKAAKEKIAAKGKEIDQEAELREKHRKLQTQKLAQGYKDNTGRTDYIKSRGNGL